MNRCAIEQPVLSETAGGMSPGAQCDAVETVVREPQRIKGPDYNRTEYWNAGRVATTFVMSALVRFHLPLKLSRSFSPWTSLSSRACLLTHVMDACLLIFRVN